MFERRIIKRRVMQNGSERLRCSFAIDNEFELSYAMSMVGNEIYTNWVGEIL